VTEDAFVLVTTLPQVFVFGLLIAARDAARVTLGRLHLRSAVVELPLYVVIPPGAAVRAASVVAVRHFPPPIGSKLRSVPPTT
jgi:hypothetical protein